MNETEQRLLSTLERLFEVSPAPVDVVLNRCADLIVEATNAQKVDAFLHEPSGNCLVAVGTSLTELARLQKTLGLDRLPIANADPMAMVFQTGNAYFCGHTDNDASQPRGVIERLGVRSMIAVPIDVGGIRRGVLSLASREYDGFTDADLRFIAILAVWVGNLVHRSELLEQNTARATEQSRRAAADELITVLAHDLRNMLNPIAGRMALLLERATVAKRAQDIDDCNRVNAALNRFTEVISDLLDVSRLERGLFSVTLEPFDLLQQLRSLAETLAPPDVGIRVDPTIEPVRLVGDRRRLSQAFENVLSNATKHSPRGADVTVRIEAAKIHATDAVKITIIDHGPGISPDLLPRVFERFVSGRRSSGLGLGLYLARAVVSAHGGLIAVTSVASQGTHCAITLPLMAAESV